MKNTLEYLGKFGCLICVAGHDCEFVENGCEIMNSVSEIKIDLESYPVRPKAQERVDKNDTKSSVLSCQRYYKR